MRLIGLAVNLALSLLVVSICAGLSGAAAQQTDADERWDRIKYGSKYNDKYREISYWGVAQVNVSDHRYGTGDAERLKLLAKDTTDKYGRLIVVPEIQGHFLKEFRRLFGDLPFNDLEIGRNERWGKFYAENRKLLDAGAGDEFRERWQAAEQARRRALYGGRAGAIYCEIKLKRHQFPIVYTIACVISAEDDLHPYFPDRPESGADMGFSSPEHIAGEIKRALTEMLKEKSAELAKIRKYRTQE
jgi:hypothetical protein